MQANTHEFSWLTIWYRPYDPNNASGYAPPCCTRRPRPQRNKQFPRLVANADYFDNLYLGNRTPSRVSVCSEAVCWLCEGRTTPSKVLERKEQQVGPSSTCGRCFPPRYTACLWYCEFIDKYIYSFQSFMQTRIFFSNNVLLRMRVATYGRITVSVQARIYISVNKKRWISSYQE